ncbi:hypothetical protein M758_5G144000 [Ceratodon purpureus]|nr:hypothetical protein M758_5G144000 [Ceratodon purpureus]
MPPHHVAWWRPLFLIALMPIGVFGNLEGDALNAFRQSLIDSNNVLESWDPTLVNPCTWYHVTCNAENSVVRVDLGNAGLSGTLVPQLGLLSNLQYLELYSNDLSGVIPVELGNLTALVSLDLYQNNLNGTIPDSLGQLSNLRFLRLNDNSFTGYIPVSLTTITGLQELYLSRNNFTGQAPDFYNLSKLENLDLSDNKFTGQAPVVSNLSKLEYLDLSDNKFTGQAPDVSNLSQLSSLNMSLNAFTGQAPKFSQFTRLSDLDLSSNNFTGSLPEIPPYGPYESLRHLNISNNKLTGSVSSLVSSLAGATNLTSLDLSNNKLGGRLPDLYNLSVVKTLNLSSNDFMGLSDNVTLFLSTLPQQQGVLDISNLDIGGPLPDWANNNISQLQLSEFLQGNPYCNKSWTSEDDSRRCTFYCGHPCIYLPQKSNNMGWKVITMATSISSAVIVLVILGFGVILRRKQKHIRDLQKKIKEADINAKRFEYSELRVATKNFASEMKLGEGAYGAVYKGILGNNLEVAVKQLFLETNKGRDDFLNEVLLISNLQHRNLVTLKGYCLHGKQTLLVYEYVDNCDLDKLLLCRHRSTDCTSDGTQPVLTWQARLNVCQGVAQGLYYLHASSQSRIIHRDIKASNILLDKKFQPKIADFGLARPIEDARSVILTQQCAGTLGYLAPEYMCHGQLSDKADVYSFGVLLLEIVSGKRNRDLSMPEDEVYLPNWAWKLHKESRLLDMKDPSLLLGENEAEEVQRVLETAVLCVQNAPEKRPSMFLAAAMLAGQANVDALPPADEIQYESWL